MSVGSLKKPVLIFFLSVVASVLAMSAANAQSNPPAEQQTESETSQQPEKQSEDKTKPQEKEKPTPTPQPKAGNQGKPVPTPKNPAKSKSPPGQIQPTPTPAPQTETRQGEKQTEATPSPKPSPTPVAEKAAETAVPQATPSPSPSVTEQQRAQIPSQQQPAPQSSPRAVPSIAQTQDSPPTGQEPEQTQASLRGELEKLAQSFTFWKLVLSLLILLLGYLINRFIALAAARVGKQKSMQAERLRRMTPFISFGLWFLVVGLVTGIFVQSMLATVALMAIAMIAAGFASQPLLRDLIGGIVILFERPFQIGDRVTIGDLQGEVKVIGLRSFFMSTSDGSMVTIPNSEILRQPTINASRGRMESLVMTELPLPAGCDLTEARRVAFEAAAVSPYAAIHQPIEVFLDESRSGGKDVRLVVRAYVFDMQYERELRSDTIERAQEGFGRLRRLSEDK